jgi:hypothetical protein
MKVYYVPAHLILMHEHNRMPHIKINVYKLGIYTQYNIVGALVLIMPLDFPVINDGFCWSLVNGTKPTISSKT